MMLVCAIATLTLANPPLTEAIKFDLDAGVQERLREYKAKPSYYAIGNVVQPVRNVHVLALRYQLVFGGTQSGVAIGVPVGAAEMGEGATTPTVQTWPVNGQNVQLLVAGVPSSGGIVDVHLAPPSHVFNGELGSEPNFPVYCRYSYEDPPGQPHTVYQRIDYNISKMLCVRDASIDTRLTFGQPNAEGVIVPDPNQAEGYVNFGSWIYKGGLFAGHMPRPTSETITDKSGTGRMQFVTGPIGPSPGYMALSLFHMPPPEIGFGLLSLGAYWPNLTETITPPENLNMDEAGMKWNNRWNIDPGGPPSNNYSRTALDVIDFPAKDGIANPRAPTNDYICWQLNATGTPHPHTTHDIQHIAICAETEGEPLPDNSWRYFSSKEYDAQTTTFPYKDTHPRLWVVRGAWGFGGP